MKTKIAHILNSSIFIVLVANTVTFIFSHVPFLEPINDSVTEWDFTDLYYKTDKDFKEDRLDTNIVIVNFGHLNRAGIANLLNEVNSYSPKVVGISANFFNERDALGDSLLENALINTRNLVLAGRLTQDTLSVERDGFYVRTSHPRFARHGRTGMTNLIPGVKDVTRSYITFEEDNNNRIYSFPFEILKSYDPDIANQILQRSDWEEIIKYQGHMASYYYVDYDNNQTLRVYNLYRSNFGWDWVESNKDLNILKDKIVLMGFVGRSTNMVKEYWVDAYYSPLKKEFLSFNIPDMYGVAILANITSMHLNQDEVTYITMNEGSLALAILLVFLITIHFLHVRTNIDNQMIDRGIALLFIFSLIFLSVKLFSLGVYLNLTLAVFYLLFAADADELYLKLYRPIESSLKRKGKQIFIYTPLFAYGIYLFLIAIDLLVNLGRIVAFPIIGLIVYLATFLIYHMIVKLKSRKSRSRNIN